MKGREQREDEVKTEEARAPGKSLSPVLARGKAQLGERRYLHRERIRIVAMWVFASPVRGGLPVN